MSLKQQLPAVWLTPPEPVDNLEDLAVIEGLKIPRKAHHKDRSPTTLVDSGANPQPAADMVVRLVSTGGWFSDTAKTPGDAMYPHEILMNSGLNWEMYSLLWDACHPDPDRDRDTRQYGTVKPRLIRDLQMMGLGFGYNLPRSGSRGRPVRTFIPTRWGKRLVELCDALGLKVPDDARMYTRYSNGRGSPKKVANQRLSDHMKALGIAPMWNDPNTVIRTNPPPTKVMENPPAAAPFDPLQHVVQETVSLREEPSTGNDLSNTPPVGFSKSREPGRTNVPTGLTQLGPPDPNQVESEKTPFTIDHRDLPEDWDKES